MISICPANTKISGEYLCHLRTTVGTVITCSQTTVSVTVGDTVRVSYREASDDKHKVLYQQTLKGYVVLLAFKYLISQVTGV